MSSSSDYQVLRMVDDRLAVDQGPRILVTETGPSSSTFSAVTPSNPNTLNPNFTINVSSQATGVNRRMFWKMSGTLTVLGTNLENFTSVAGRVAFRQFPLQSAVDSCQVEINDTTLSVGTLSQIIHALLAKGTTSKSYGQELSLTNSCPDIVCEYESAVGTPLFEAPSGNAYSNYTSGSRTKGALSIAVSPATAATTMTINFEILEPLLCQPFTYGAESNDQSLFGINTLKVTLNMSNVHRMLSLAIPSGSTVTSVTLTPTYQALLVGFVTPENSSFLKQERYLYGYVQAQPFETTLSSGPLAPQATLSGSSNSIDLPVVPKGFLIYATISETDRRNPALSIPSFCFPIESIQLKFMTRSGLLSGASKEQLYITSQRNGINLPAEYWLGQQLGSSVAATGTGVGGVLYIDTASDLSLPQGVSPGMSIKAQFAVESVVVRNQTTQTYSGVRLIVVPLTQGLLTNNQGSSYTNLGGVPLQDSEEIKQLPTIMRSELERLSRNGGYGGAVLGGKHGRRFRHFLRSLGNFSKKALKVAAPLVEEAYPEAAPYIEKGRRLLGASRTKDQHKPRVQDMYDLLE